MKQRNGRIFAGVLCLLLAACFAVSGIFIVTHIHHDCVGEDCPVCAILVSCGQALRGLALMAALWALRFTAPPRARYRAAQPSGGTCHNTLVSLKVLLLN